MTVRGSEQVMPQAPDGLHIHAKTSNKITVGWGSQNAVKFNLFVKKGRYWKLYATTKENTYTLRANEGLQFRVTAENSCGISDFSSVLNTETDRKKPNHSREKRRRFWVNVNRKTYSMFKKLASEYEQVSEAIFAS